MLLLLEKTGEGEEVPCQLIRGDRSYLPGCLICLPVVRREQVGEGGHVDDTLVGGDWRTPVLDVNAAGVVVARLLLVDAVVAVGVVGALLPASEPQEVEAKYQED